MIDLEKYINTKTIEAIKNQKNTNSIDIEAIKKEINKSAFKGLDFNSEQQEIKKIVSGFLDDLSTFKSNNLNNIEDNLYKDLLNQKENFESKIEQLLDEDFYFSKDFSLLSEKENSNTKFSYHFPKDVYNYKSKISYFNFSYDNKITSFFSNVNNSNKQSINKNFINSMKYGDYLSESINLDNDLFKDSNFVLTKNIDREGLKFAKEQLMKDLIIEHFDTLKPFFLLPKLIKDLNLEMSINSKQQTNLRYKMPEVFEKKNNIKSLINPINDMLEFLSLTEDLYLKPLDIDDIMPKRNKGYKPLCI